MPETPRPDLIQDALTDQTAESVRADAPPPVAPPANARAGAEPALAPPREPEVLLRVTLALFAIGFGVWVLLAGAAHRRSYSATGAAWHRGAHNFIEITLVAEDHGRLSCASDAVIDGLHCGFSAGGQPHPLAADGDDARVLRPYNTVNGELFLGAGLWDSPAMRAGLPAQRFTVFCDYDIAGAWRAVALRWAVAGAFAPVDKSVSVGTLRDCAIPR